MSYTYKKVLWKTCRVSSGSIVDEFGDLNQPKQVTIIARKQPYEDVIKTSDGRELLTRSVFYVDPKVEKNAFKIGKLDLLDGERVERIYEMCDLHNNVKMIRFITV